MKVSVLIPVYNQEDLLERCVNSIPARNDIEIIILNDCSTDNTYQVMRKLAKERQNIKLKFNRTNQGVGISRNKLLDTAIGEYVFFLDADDYIIPEVFNEVIDNELTADIVECMKETNAGKPYYSRVHQSHFVARKLFNGVRCDDLTVGEDTQLRLLIDQKYPNHIVKKFDKVVYHYDFPREGSLTWQKKHEEVEQTAENNITVATNKPDKVEQPKSRSVEKKKSITNSQDYYLYF